MTEQEQAPAGACCRAEGRRPSAGHILERVLDRRLLHPERLAARAAPVRIRGPPPAQACHSPSSPPSWPAHSSSPAWAPVLPRPPIRLRAGDRPEDPAVAGRAASAPSSRPCGSTCGTRLHRCSSGAESIRRSPRRCSATPTAITLDLYSHVTRSNLSSHTLAHERRRTIGDFG